MSDDLARELEVVKRMLESAESNVRGLMSDSRFWRTAAEQAVHGWEALEDKLDTVVQRLGELHGYVKDLRESGKVPSHVLDNFDMNLAEALELLVELDPLEPPDAPLMNQPVDIGNGEKLTLVEEETPLKGVGIVEED